MSTLYRTNSFTGNDNPVKLTTEMLADDKDQADVLLQLSCNVLVPSTNIELLDRIKSMALSDGAQRLADFKSRDREYRVKFYEEAVAEAELIRGIKLTYCCWLTNKAVVMSRSKGYGLRMHSENGLLKCNDTHFPLLTRDFDILACFDNMPRLQPDIVTNKNLISKEQLDKLLSLEKDKDKLLAETCLKKDVMNILKRAQIGLLDKDYSTSVQRQQERSPYNRERELQDLL